MTPLRILSQQGPALDALVAARLPGTALIAVPVDGPWTPVRGDVLLAVPWGTPTLGEAASQVAWVHVLSTGVDQFPLAAVPHQVVVTCSRGASAVPIAEFVLASMLAFEKRLPEVWVCDAPERWALAELGTLAGRVLGIVGMGAIGRAVAMRALAFDMQVKALRRTDGDVPTGVERCADLPAVMADADHVVLAAPATSLTRRMIDGAALAAARPGVHLINVGRGSLVDQDALVRALDSGHIARATLDVVEPEPLPAGHLLYRHPRVRLSPHVSWSSPGALERMVDCFADEVARRVAGQPLSRLVDRAAGY